MKSLLCSTRLPSLITAVGSLPLYLYLIFNPSFISMIIVQFYVYGVICFIAGINWVTALQNNKLSMICWSIFISVTPLIFFILQDNNIISENFNWAIILVYLWLSLIYDFFNRKLVNLKYFFCFRRSGTVFLSIGIVLIILINK